MKKSRGSIKSLIVGDSGGLGKVPRRELLPCGRSSGFSGQGGHREKVGSPRKGPSMDSVQLGEHRAGNRSRS